MKVYKITEEQFLEIKERQKRWEYYDNFDKYLEEHEDDLMFYDPLWMDGVSMDVPIYVEGSMSYIAYDHPLWLYTKDDNDKLVPFSISRIPQILVDKNTYKFNLSEEQINNIKSFIIDNYYALYEYGKMKIERHLFRDYLQRCNICKHLLLTEMPVIRSERTGLKMDIWVDGERKMQHGPRIRFKSNNDDNPRTWASCTISDTPTIKNLPQKNNFTGKDITNLENFVIYNKDLLLSLYSGVNNKMEDEDIIKRIIKIGKNGGPIYSKEMFDEPMLSFNKDNLIDIYIDIHDRKLCFISKHNNEITNGLFREVAKSKKFKLINPYTVMYIPLEFDGLGLIRWGSKMKAVSCFKEIASSKGYNIKMHNE